MSDNTDAKNEKDTKPRPRPGGDTAPAPRSEIERRTNPGNTKVVAQDQGVQKPLKRGAKAAGVQQVIEDANLETITVNATDQSEQEAQVARENLDGPGSVKNVKDRDVQPQTRQWYSDIPANPNDLLRSNHGTADAVTG